MRILSIILFSLAASINAYSQAYYTESGTAIFHSEVPLHTFSGTSNYLTGKIDLDTKIVDFYLDLTTLDTGIAKRDRDMRETLETDQFPFAEFYGKMISPFDPNLQTPQDVTVQGAFKIHGVSKDTTYKGTLTMTDDGLLLEASWVLLLKDYDIVPPSLLFVKVDQEQKIEINAMLKPLEDN